ncbi:MAG: NADH-quinone oxidoreductase subunit L [Acidobacteriaceae bacterium]|jgi:NADH-quinone oxidoreductase subunit L|nr:NADH-quinone oxidoreductase subunit L [Acidobacteriaceae bacterium]
MLLLIPLLPFFGFLVNASFGRRLTKSASGSVACAVMLAAFGVAALSVWQLLGMDAHNRAIEQHVFDWIVAGDFRAPLTLRLDPLSSLMILVITGIGSLIHIYSTAYMHEEIDSEYARYFSYLNLFASFMLVLVLGANFLVMFVGWEGVGLCSYLLIGFYYQKKSASDAGKKAFIVNRVGDFGFILGVLLLFVRFGSVDFQEIARHAAGLSPEVAFGTLSLATLLLFVGATGKSAQIPLYIWLPDAMEGPTPVSALIHAATMVTAGVYMIGRNAVLFSHAPETLQVIAVVGVVTAFMAGTIGLVQNDIKRVLAYSTVSQLGYMFLAMGVGAYTAGIFHLYTHAFFKALMFLGSGAVIHALAGEQDIRRMGGLKSELPVTYWTFLIGALAIAGVPLLSGFFSKDEILYRTYASGHTWLWVLGVATSLLTAIYMFRLVFLTFHGTRATADVVAAAQHGHDGGHGHDDAHGHDAHGHHLHDAPKPMAFALIVLAVGSILAGYVGVPQVIGGSNRIEQFLEPSFTVSERAGADIAGLDAVREHQSEESGPELMLMAVSSLIALSGIGIAFFFFQKNPSASDSVATQFAGLRTLLSNKYYVDELYDATIIQPIKIVSEEGLWKAVDAKVIDGSVNGVAESVGSLSELLRRLQTGSVRAYAASLFLGVVLTLGYYLWR